MEDYLDRINKLIEIEDITVSKLETIIGASKNVLHKPLKNKTDIQTKWIIKISENYPRYNLNWLLTGQGEMLINRIKENQIVSEPEAVYKIHNKGDRLLRMIESQQRTIESQQRTIENLTKGGGKGADSA